MFLKKVMHTVPSCMRDILDMLTAEYHLIMHRCYKKYSITTI